MKRGPYKKVPVNIEEVQIDESKSKDARIKEYLKQVKDPYHIKIGGVLVEMEYSEDTGSMQEMVEILVGMDQ